MSMVHYKFYSVVSPRDTFSWDIDSNGEIDYIRNSSICRHWESGSSKFLKESVLPAGSIHKGMSVEGIDGEVWEVMKVHLVTTRERDYLGSMSCSFKVYVQTPREVRKESLRSENLNMWGDHNV